MFGRVLMVLSARAEMLVVYSLIDSSRRVYSRSSRRGARWIELAEMRDITDCLWTACRTTLLVHSLVRGPDIRFP